MLIFVHRKPWVTHSEPISSSSSPPWNFPEELLGAGTVGLGPCEGGPRLSGEPIPVSR